MNDSVLLTLWLGAFRYYVGRKTYAVSDFCRLLIAHWDELPERCKLLIRKELDQLFAKDDEMRADPACSSNYYPLGMEIDRAEWEKVRAKISQ